MEKLNSIFFYQLEKAIKVYRQFAQSNLRKNGCNITIDQWMVLKAVMENPDITQQELSVMVFKDKASVTRIIDLLVKNNYLKRAAHEESRRRNRLLATAKSNKVMKEIMPVVFRNRAAALKGVSKERMAATEKVLHIISANCANGLTLNRKQP